MKTNFILLSAMALVIATSVQAQSDLQNTGTLYVSGNTDTIYHRCFYQCQYGALTNNVSYMY